ncbi:hypothetical protein QQZ08_004072 [Neonectria magnoliae]|uniref:Rhodopsin domain-containing protein n=1 Tax=Neonectria magnoliae TaxID=2732573 RepID=A0ABR1I7E6_9HYPO
MATVTPPDPLPPDSNVGPVLLGVSATLIAFVIITTSLRIWVRSSNRILGWDDYTIVIVTGLGIARFAIQVAQVQIGNGRHRWFIANENYVSNNMLGWVAQILLFASICLLKVSILLLLLRIEDSRWSRYTSWVIMAGLVVTNFGAIVILLAECHPVEAYWTGVGKCWDARIRIYWIYFTIWVYAITAIWSNLELYLGIIGANLALGRSMFVYFFRGGKSNGSSYVASGSNAAYMNSGYRIDNTNNTTTFIRSNRAPSPSRSDNSDIPLEPGIQKRTEIWVGEETISLNSRRRNP